jgi:hypothetical protein
VADRRARDKKGLVLLPPALAGAKNRSRAEPGVARPGAPKKLANFEVKILITTPGLRVTIKLHPVYGTGFGNIKMLMVIITQGKDLAFGVKNCQVVNPVMGNNNFLFICG